MKENEELAYLSLLDEILTHGDKIQDRTGVGTLAVFGKTLEFDLKDYSLPIVSTRKINPKFPLLELIWFMRGDTNVKYLIRHGCHIWDNWVIPHTA